MSSDMSDIPHPGYGSTFTHKGYFVNHLDTMSDSMVVSRVLGRTVVMVSTLQEECSQSIQIASKPRGATSLAVGTVLKARYRPRRAGILPSWASRIASRV